MFSARTRTTTLMLAVLLGWPLASSLAGEDARGRDIDTHAIYERLQIGMTVKEVAAVADRPQLLATAEPLHTWLLWNQPATGRPTGVLRTSFRDGRLVRAEHESFGDAYQRVAKGGDPGVEIGEDELRRLWRRTWRASRAAEQCQDALEAFHRLVLGAQERLTAAEQASWVRALELRRAAEQEGSAAR